MFAKLTAIFGSVRFWLLTLAAASVYAGLIQANGFDWKQLFDTLATWLAAVTAVGTVDKFGVSIGTKK